MEGGTPAPAPVHVDSQFELYENDRLSIAYDDCNFRAEQECSSKYDEDFMRKWGFKLKDLYSLALTFYKEKEGKAVSLSYQDRIKLVALTKQVTIGKYNLEKAPPLGVLDVIGRDRRLAWQSLGDLSAEDAMVEFIELVDNRCTMFRPYAQAHKADRESRLFLQKKEEVQKTKEETETKQNEIEENHKNEEDNQNLEMHKKNIMEALNRQTYSQFKTYVEQHFPGDIEKQEVLMKQLQEQHYQQYMEQLMSRFTDQNQVVPESNGHLQEVESDEETIPSMAITTASLWTRDDIKEFKSFVKLEGGDAIIKVGHGETVTVRVPTNDEGTCLFWEFATDYYDIGFGVFFEWTKSPTNQVSVHISESEDDDDYVNDDDDDDDDDEEFDGIRVADVERGLGKVSAIDSRPPTTEILPVRRRDCFQQVYAGSHAYPGTGVYLLKFDNSYSFWRSKTLYYRVFYTR